MAKRNSSSSIGTRRKQELSSPDAGEILTSKQMAPAINPSRVATSARANMLPSDVFAGQCVGSLVLSL